MLIVDAHLDLAMNAIEWNRDLTRPIDEIRAREAGMTDKPDRARGTVSFGEMRRGGVGLCVATQIARYVASGSALSGWHSPEQAWAMTQAQLAWYRAMEERGELVQIRDRAGLDTHVERWRNVAVVDLPPEVELPPKVELPPNRLRQGYGESAEALRAKAEGGSYPTRGEKYDPSESGGANLPIGYVLSLEGADSIITPAHLERAYASGLRAIGPAHYGPGRYAQGTNASGGLGPAGRELLREMERLGIILDVTHLCDDSLRDALDHFNGAIWASHSNCRALVPHNRQFSDEQIRELIERDAIIGAAFDAWMLAPGWVRGETTPEAAGVSLETVANHIDHVCQIAGNARHSAIGSDLDGAFGREQCPADLHTIADLSNLPGILRTRGYTEEDIRAIGHGNFLRLLHAAWR